MLGGIFLAQRREAIKMTWGPTVRLKNDWNERRKRTGPKSYLSIASRPSLLLILFIILSFSLPVFPLAGGKEARIKEKNVKTRAGTGRLAWTQLFTFLLTDLALEEKRQRKGMLKEKWKKSSSRAETARPQDSFPFPFFTQHYLAFIPLFHH